MIYVLNSNMCVLVDVITISVKVWNLVVGMLIEFVGIYLISMILEYYDSNIIGLAVFG